MPEAENRSAIIEALFHEYGNAIYRYVKYSVPADIDAADVVQEVFVRAFRAWDDFEGRSDPKTWLFRIARNYVYDVLRKKRNERKFLAEQSLGSFSQNVALDTFIELEDALCRLNQTDQQVLNLRLIQDLSVTETAKIMNWTEIKVRVTFHRAKKRLQAILTETSDVADWNAKGGDKVGTDL